VIEHGSGARRALEWFLNRSEVEPSDRDLDEFRWFLELIIEGGGDHVTLPDWERRQQTHALDRAAPIH
jgi:hypothetical protein